MQILLIDENKERFELLGKGLASLGFLPIHRPSVDRALRDRESPAAAAAAIVLVMPETQGAGSDLVRALRIAGLTQPLLLLSSPCNWRERVEALDAGADDCIILPIRTEELAARLRAAIRREAGATGTRLEIGDFVCDLKAQAIWMGGQTLDLTRNEFRLLQGFLLRRDFILSREAIRDLLYSSDPLSRTDNAVEVYISRLRRKIGHQRIRTFRGLGYRVLINLPGTAQGLNITPEGVAHSAKWLASAA